MSVLGLSEADHERRRRRIVRDDRREVLVEHALEACAIAAGLRRDRCAAR
jgi:hypothetical protein